MQLVILHYHLNRGGVTSVVENHLRSLATLPSDLQPSRAAIVYGGRAEAWKAELADELPFECELVAVPELEYDNQRSGDGELLNALLSALSGFDRDSTILHIHNHSLGKNAEMAPVVCHLAEQGRRLLLQIHDFAEDLRPANYGHLLDAAASPKQLQLQLYPQAPQIRYAALNGRDQDVLTQAGINSDDVHRLPNPVRESHFVTDDEQREAARSKLAGELALPPGQRLVLYPVRPIRRKNVGELLLWSLLADRITFALTLKPLNPQELITYQHWVDLAAELQLPVQFEIATKTDLPFEQVYAAADAIITTSVTEGFGLVYLEASLAGKPLVGRSLPGISDDFVAAGMQFPGLADAISVPAEQLDMNELRASHLRHIESLRAAYHLPSDDAADLSAIDAQFSGDIVDFARLDLNQQTELLTRLKTDPALRDTLRDLNPVVNALNALADIELEATLANNRRIIAEHYSPAVVGRQLSEIYQRLLDSPPGDVTRDADIARAILQRFVHPSRLYPIRLEA